MQFPQRDEMTSEQVAMNKTASSDLVRGSYYRFDPPIKATGIPTGGPRTCALAEVEFDRGWYIGFADGNHLFQGKPINDCRTIATPPGYESALNLEEVIEKLRECYFHVLFIGGVTASLDNDQRHH